MKAWVTKGWSYCCLVRWTYASYIRSVLTAIEAHYRDPSNPYPGEDNAVLYELTPYLETAGINDPLTKVIVGRGVRGGGRRRCLHLGYILVVKKPYMVSSLFNLLSC